MRLRYLFSRLGDGNQVSAELDEVRLSFEDLHVSGLGHLDEVLLVLQGLVLLVVRHTEDSKPGLQSLVPLGEHHEPGKQESVLRAMLKEVLGFHPAVTI